MKKALSLFSIAVTGLMFASAQTLTIGQTATQGQVNGGALISLLRVAQDIVARLVPFAVGVAVLAFFWFLILWIWKGRDDAAAKTNSMKGMGYSILALFVMVSIWGIIGMLGSVFGIGQGGLVPIPEVPVLIN